MTQNGDYQDGSDQVNKVNESNFNETCKGYVVRAIKIANEDKVIFNDVLIKKLMKGLRWAFDEMTMEDARREYEKYRNR